MLPPLKEALMPSSSFGSTMVTRAVPSFFQSHRRVYSAVSSACSQRTFAVMEQPGRL